AKAAQLKSAPSSKSSLNITHKCVVDKCKLSPTITTKTDSGMRCLIFPEKIMVDAITNTSASAAADTSKSATAAAGGGASLRAQLSQYQHQ
ncbi:hypothetical protein, partial [Mucilaginibacter sp. 10I4]|uniref:hypothetical protein n=1 Tax=Mucilaginibacter sp. 10I4 TaxID=3048580 RepID=UPI002B2338AF